jgi:hypothetical protein
LRYKASENFPHIAEYDAKREWFSYSSSKINCITVFTDHINNAWMYNCILCNDECMKFALKTKNVSKENILSKFWAWGASNWPKILWKPKFQDLEREAVGEAQIQSVPGTGAWQTEFVLRQISPKTCKSAIKKSGALVGRV